MKDFIKNIQVNVELAAAVYLSAQTEAIATHNQRYYISPAPNCGTNACLAGHAVLLEYGSVERVMDVICTDAISSNPDAGPTYPREATRLLLKGADSLPRTLTQWGGCARELHETGDITEDEYREFMACVYELGHAFSIDHTPTEALDAFSDWVHNWASEDEFARFEELISLDVDELYQKANIDRTALAA